MATDSPAPGLRTLGAPRQHASRPWRSSIRLRYAVVATAMAAATFAVGGGVALVIYRNNLISTVEQDVRTSARQFAISAQRGVLPSVIPMPVGPAAPRVQVVNSAGRIVSGDPASVTTPPLPYLASVPSDHLVEVTNPKYLPEHRAAMIVARATSSSGPVTIIVSQSLDPADTKALHAFELSAILAGGSLLLVALVAWFATGRTLRRVDIIRAQVTDITHSGDLTQQLGESGTDELGRLAHTLNEMLAAMANSSDRQRRFVADAAHELRTPLAGVSATLDVAIRHPETVTEGWMNELAGAHRRLTRLVNDLLELAGLEGGRSQSTEPVDLAGVVADASRRHLPAEVRVEATRVEPAYVDSTETQLERIVTNLVDNAQRHARSSVHISLATQDRQAVLVVEDDGPGVAPADHERIWERFGRSDTHRARSDGGTGLGLALVKELTEVNGGSVTVTRSEGLGGAKFIARLPLSEHVHPGSGPPRAIE